MSGFLRSASEKPTAFNIARAGARLGPVVRGLPWPELDDFGEWACPELDDLGEWACPELDDLDEWVMKGPRKDRAASPRASSSSRRSRACGASAQTRRDAPARGCT